MAASSTAVKAASDKLAMEARSMSQGQVRRYAKP
jgi:hypothetical protein